MNLLIVYVVIALAISFVCSLLQATLFSVSPAYLAVMEKKDNRFAGILLAFKEDIDRPLSALLSLNTIAQVLGAVGVGVQAQSLYGNEVITIVAVITTLLILVLAEIVPRSLGAYYWKPLMPVTAYITQPIIYLMYPFVLISRGMNWWFQPDNNEPTFSREEFSAMAEQGAEEGVFAEDESQILKNLIRFRSLRIKDIMTPRIVVVGFHKEKTVGEIFSQHGDLRFSRLPVYGEDEDDIIGYVLKNDLLMKLAKDEKDTLLEQIKRDVLILPETISLQDLFEQLLENQEHIAVAVDEYGGFSGVVTMEDVVETLLGMEIVDEIDAIEDMQKLARKQWRERARRLGIVEPEMEEGPEQTE